MKNELHLADDPSRKIQNARLLTFLVMMLERTVLAFSPLILWGMAFCALFLLAGPHLSTNFIHLASAVFYIGFGIWFLSGARQLKRPTREDIDRRLEKANRLKHRPFAFLKDSIANPERATTRDLWRRQYARANASLLALRPPLPKFHFARKDKYALRIGFLVLLAVSFVIAGSSWQERLKQGFVPNLAKTLFPDQDPATLWVAPPDYTKLERSIHEYADSQNKTIRIPEQSTVKIRARSSMGTPIIQFADQSIEMKQAGDKLFEFETEISDTNINSIRITQFFMTRAKWPVTVVEDTPPELAIAEEPAETDFQALRFPLTAKDDYGIQSLKFSMKAAPLVLEPPLGEPVEKDRAVNTSAGQTQIKPVFDLTDHPWAGLPVEIELVASDSQQQKSKPVIINTVLPERQFEHPVSKKLVAYRKQLAWYPVESAPEIASGLNRLLMFPEEMQHDTVAYLSLQTAASRLEKSPSTETALIAMDIMWNVAIKLEDGNLALAMRELKDAHQDLSNAIQTPDLPEQELEKKLETLQNSLSTYMQEFSRELQKQMESEETLPKVSPEILEETLNPEALAEFLNQLEKNVLQGNQEKSEQLLSQLEQLMETLTPSLTEPMSEDMKEMIGGVNELQELIENLRDLKYQTENIAKEKESAQTNMPSFREYFGPQDQEFIPPTTTPDGDILKQWNFGEFPPPPQNNPETGPNRTKEDQNAAQNPQTGSGKGKDSETSEKTPTDSPSEVYSGKEEEQKAMRYILGHLMKETGEFYGEIPENMGEAEFLMRDAEDLLLEENATNAVPKQQEAIEKLQQAQQELAKKLEQMLQQDSETAMGKQQTDPLGRPQHGRGKGTGEPRDGLLGSFVEIPEESQRRYVQDILRKLREKAGEINRPKVERDYIDRLLEQF